MFSHISPLLPTILSSEVYMSLHDLKGSKLMEVVSISSSTLISSWLLNLVKRENPTLTEWDRFAHREYIPLSMEEDSDDASNCSAYVWDESLEA